MKVLLDTATFLWLAHDSPRLSPEAKRTFTSPENTVYLSVVSCWEIGVKHQLGKLPLPSPPQAFVPALREELAVESLPLDEASTMQLPKLPDIHRDPFDRMLICQAIEHALTLITPDETLQSYPVRTLW